MAEELADRGEGGGGGTSKVGGGRTAGVMIEGVKELEVFRSWTKDSDRRMWFCPEVGTQLELL